MPDWKRLVEERLAGAKLDAADDADLADEIAQHLEDYCRDLSRSGISDDEAFRRAMAELEDVDALRTELERTRRMTDVKTVAGEPPSPRVLESLGQDLRYAGRAMRKGPLFVLSVVVTLALGIGGTTTVFTVINTLILNPLVVEDPSRLAGVAMTRTEAASTAAPQMPMSLADLRDYQAQNTVFAALAGYTPIRLVTWQRESGSRALFGELVTGNYFSTLGLKPAKGRFFLPEEDVTPGRHAVAVMNHGTWQTLFGGTDDIIGTTLRLNNVAFTVVGVAPPQFIGIHAVAGPDVWIPASMAERLLPNAMERAFSDRARAAFYGVGRLQPDTTRAQAQANIATIASALARDYPATHAGATATVHSMRELLLEGGDTPILFASAGLLIVVAIVLLIACSNVANLMLARAAGRQQEMAIRLALGASRTRLVRQLLTESVVLGLLSGVVGVVLAYAGLQLLFSALPSAANFVRPRLDSTVLAFSLSVSVATGLLFGGLPAFTASQTRVAETLKQETLASGRGKRKIALGNALLVGQVAFSFLLLVLAALFLRSMQRAYLIDPGFQTAHLAVFIMSPGQAGYQEPQARAFYREAREQIATMPDVRSASWASNMPLWAGPVNGLEVEGRAQRSQTDTLATIVNTVDVDYFDTLGVSIESGRPFTVLDTTTSTKVAIVNDTLARAQWPDGTAIGKRIRVPGETEMREIVGIARTANYSGWGEPPQSCVYVPLEQKYGDTMVMYVRTLGDPSQAVLTVTRRLGIVAPQILVSNTRTGPEVIEGGLFQARMGVALLSVFGLLALGLASVGLYGVMAYSVFQRRREIGLRMALGAPRPTVLRLVLRQGMTLVLAGVLLGLAAAVATGRLLNTLLYGVGASDVVSIAGAAAVLLSVALLACYLPARWASRVDPLIALREQ